MGYWNTACQPLASALINDRSWASLLRLQARAQPGGRPRDLRRHNTYASAILRWYIWKALTLSCIIIGSGKYYAATRAPSRDLSAVLIKGRRKVYAKKTRSERRRRCAGGGRTGAPTERGP
ncbi:hypothetical protein EVAR_55400_1 [Eumeta japonica]|uniref:Uncharacterized protein n=1 Tax=Eumeta variegata TaxID=151549 RepID=A0A4C1YNB2_EUMVA|nr:hypothetical protein EVAR_55400_1 [Eumeta japonica]